MVGGAQWESSELRAFPGQERGGRPAGELLPSHKASLLSAALAQTKSRLALGPPEGPKVRADAEGSRSKASWRPPATGRPRKVQRLTFQT